MRLQDLLLLAIEQGIPLSTPVMLWDGNTIPMKLRDVEIEGVVGDYKGEDVLILTQVLEISD